MQWEGESIHKQKQIIPATLINDVPEAAFGDLPETQLQMTQVL